MPKHYNDIAWRIGGPQGSGVDTAAGIFARACAAGGLHIVGRREYYSNIMGRHSYFDVRVSSAPLRCHRSRVDILTTFDAETLARHALNVRPGGVILCDERHANVAFDELPFFDAPLNEVIAQHLDEHNLAHTTEGLLQEAQRRGVRTIAVPYKSITQQLAEGMKVGASLAERALNTIAVALACALLHYGPDFVRSGIRSIFSDRQKAIAINDASVQLAYEYAHDQILTADPEWELTLSPEPTALQEERILISGSQATALGKLAGGMTFQTYYPISPATDESLFLEAHSAVPLHSGEEGNVVVVQTEDEQAAVTMAVGAALTGARSATATSGPGFSLMAEGIGWAGINEVPVVVTLYQRGGPSTGLPTRTEQGDLAFALHTGHGEFGRIVLASGDIEEAFRDAAQAFNYAERFQTPVIHLLDKALASTTRTVPSLDAERVTVERGLLFEPASHEERSDRSYLRFEATPSGISARAFLGQPEGAHWLTGGEHTEQGRVTEDPTERERQMEKRARKIATAAQEIPDSERLALYGDEDASLTILSWGSTKGAILEAMEYLKDDSLPSRLAHVRLLAPFPCTLVESVVARAKRVVVVELNYSGQFAQLLLRETGRRPDHLILKYNGRPFGVDELSEALRQVHSGTAPDRLVVRNPLE